MRIFFIQCFREDVSILIRCQDFYAVPGDLFSLYTHPGIVYKPVAEIFKAAGIIVNFI